MTKNIRLGLRKNGTDADNYAGTHAVCRADVRADSDAESRAEHDAEPVAAPAGRPVYRGECFSLSFSSSGATCIESERVAPLELAGAWLTDNYKQDAPPELIDRADTRAERFAEKQTQRANICAEPRAERRAGVRAVLCAESFEDTRAAIGAEPCAVIRAVVFADDCAEKMSPLQKRVAEMSCRNRAEPYAVLRADLWQKNGTDTDDGAEKQNAESCAVVRADDFAEPYAERRNEKCVTG